MCPVLIGVDEANRLQLVGEEGEGASAADVLIDKPSSSKARSPRPRVVSKAAGVKRTRRKEEEGLDPEYQEFCDNLLALWVASSTLPVTLTRHPGMKAWVKALNSKVSKA